MDIAYQPPVTLSLCSGYGGLERGIERAIGRPLSVAAYVEIEAFIIENLVSLMEQGLLAPATVWTDVKTFPCEGFRGKINLITAGYPCQPFSVAGNIKGTADPRHLWPHIRRIVESIKPVCCFFENVPNHLNVGFEGVSRDLRKMGYRVEAGIYSAEEVGAPHQRKRLFIMGFSASFDGELSESKRWQSNIEIAGAGEKLADTRHTKSSGRKFSEKRKQRQSSRDKLASQSSSDKELADTSSKGLQVGKEQSSRQERSSTKRGSDKTMANPNSIGTRQGLRSEQSEQPNQNSSEGETKWPASPNQPQKNWEAPRTVESGVGCTIDGYNFRADLLRMYGNGVVEQTAALAFNELCKKHGIKII